MRNLVMMMAAAALLTSPLAAAPCKDAKGKFAKCVKHAAKKGPCRNAKGHFTKCK